MVITYQGDNYFRIQSGEFVVLVDPTNARSLKGANLVLNTVKPPPITSETNGSSLWVENQGEYEVGGVRLTGWSMNSEDSLEKTAYVFKLEDISIAVLGQITKEPSPELLEHFEKIDIAIVPCGHNHLSETSAAKIIRQLEPGIVIPSFVAAPPKKLFAELGQNSQSEEKLVIKKKEISPTAMKIIYLTVK